MPSVGSLFSGAGGFDLGFEAAGFEVVWQVEIDRDCVSVLERHWPATPRYGDVRTVNGADLAPVDVMIGGFPCQDLSVAGKRAGLEGARSGLYWEVVRIVREMREATGGRYPAQLAIENVPGLLSSGVSAANPGGDFAEVLAGLGQLGAAVAWRILDARFFGVPQRRRRVFIVADFAELGVGERRAAEVLSLLPGGSGDLEARRTAGERAPSHAEGGAGVVGFAENYTAIREQDVAPSVGLDGHSPHVNTDGFMVLAGDVEDGAGGFSESGPGWWRNGVGALRAEGENRPSRPSTLVAFGGNNTSGALDVATACNAHGGPHGRQDFESETFIVADTVRSHPRPGSNSVGNLTVAASVTSSAGHHGHSSPRGDGSDNLIPVAFHMTQDPINGPESPALGAGNEHGCSSIAVAITENVRAEVRETAYANALAGGGGKIGQGYQAVREGMAVRRLTPRECERLQGWADDRKTVTIHVWDETHPDDRSLVSAAAEMRCTTEQSSALAVAGSAFLPRARCVAQDSSTSHPALAPRAVLRVLIDLERMAVEISSHGVSPSPAGSAVSRLTRDDLPNSGGFAHAAALISSALGRTTTSGRVASPPHTTPSTPQRSGSRCVVVSGREIEEHADGAASSMRTATELLTSTTSAVGSSSPSFDSILTTLCCSVIHAIAGSIPEPIRSVSSYDCELTLFSGHTQFRANGDEISDGPRYRMIGNGVAAPVAAWVAGRMRAALEGVP